MFQLQVVSRSSLTDETNPAVKICSQSSMVSLSHEGGLDSVGEKNRKQMEERRVNIHTPQFFVEVEIQKHQGTVAVFNIECN